MPLRSPTNASDGCRTSTSPVVAHLEDADLVGRAEPVLDAAQDAVLVVPVALQVEHGVDHVLQHARSGDRAFLGDMADEHHRECRCAWPTRMTRAGIRAPATRCPASTSSSADDIVWIESITSRAGASLLRCREDAADVGLRQAPEVLGLSPRAGPPGA